MRKRLQEAPGWREGRVAGEARLLRHGMNGETDSERGEKKKRVLRI